MTEQRTAQDTVQYPVHDAAQNTVQSTAVPHPDAGPVAEQTTEPRAPLTQQLEAILVVADEPISVVGLASAVDRPVREVRAAIADLAADYDGEAAGPMRGFELREVAGGYRLYVRESLDGLVADFVHSETPSRLSQAALETLTVIAYRQPISRGAIASIRAVNVDSVVRTLVSRGLITEADHDPETGAILYGTTDALLEHLGLASLDELPPIAPMLDDGSEGFDAEGFESERL